MPCRTCTGQRVSIGARDAKARRERGQPAEHVRLRSAQVRQLVWRRVPDADARIEAADLDGPELRMHERFPRRERAAFVLVLVPPRELDEVRARDALVVLHELRRALHAEPLEQIPQLDDVAERTIGRGSVYLWIDANAPRATVAYGRVTATGCAIYGVYTPPESRRRGYATAAVATLSKRLLESGRSFCSLYTDLANPTSNSIYAKIGYEPVRDDTQISFAP